MPSESPSSIGNSFAESAQVFAVVDIGGQPQTEGLLAGYVSGELRGGAGPLAQAIPNLDFVTHTEATGVSHLSGGDIIKPFFLCVGRGIAKHYRLCNESVFLFSAG